MAIKRRAIQERDTVSVRVDFGEAGDLNVVIFPGKMTYGLRKKIVKAAEADDYDTMLECLLKIFKSWDLLDDKGKPEPLTMAVFEDLGEDVLAEIMQAINEATSPKAQTSTSSSDG